MILILKDTTKLKTRLHGIFFATQLSSLFVCFIILISSQRELAHAQVNCSAPSSTAVLVIARESGAIILGVVERRWPQAVFPLSCARAHGFQRLRTRVNILRTDTQYHDEAMF